MLNKELSQFSDRDKSGKDISKYIMTFLDKEHDHLDTGPEPTPTPSPGTRKILEKIEELYSFNFTLF